MSTERKNGEVIEITSSDQYEKLYKKGLVIVDFNTTWCGPCKNFAPVFKQIAKDFPELIFLSVNAEEIEHVHCETVKSVPTFKIFLNGELKREFSGTDKEKLLRYINRYRIQIYINGKSQRHFSDDLKQEIINYMKK